MSVISQVGTIAGQHNKNVIWKPMDRAVRSMSHVKWQCLTDSVASWDLSLIYIYIEKVNKIPKENIFIKTSCFKIGGIVLPIQNMNSKKKYTQNWFHYFCHKIKIIYYV